MATLASNRFKKELWSGTIDGTTDVFKIILMASGFEFNQDTHEGYADVSADELPTASGYTVGGNTLAGVSITQNNTTNQGIISWNNTSWTAAGGDLTAVGAIIYDDTHVDDVVLGFIDFGAAQTTLDGGTFTIVDVESTINDAS